MSGFFSDFEGDCDGEWFSLLERPWKIVSEDWEEGFNTKIEKRSSEVHSKLHKE